MPGPTLLLPMPPKGWRRTIAPVVGRLMYKLPARMPDRHCSCSRSSRLSEPEVKPNPVAFTNSMPSASVLTPITPSRGPKNSVPCVSDPGCTFHFTPGETRCELSSTPTSGITAHDSPCSNSLRPFSSAAGRRLNQRAHAGGQTPRRPNSQTLHRVAKHLAKRCVVIHFVFQDQKRRSRALLAAMAERTGHHVLDRQGPDRPVR